MMTNDKISGKQETTTFQRSKHNRENPYAQISKKMLEDKQLSIKSKGFMCYILGKPDNWISYPRQLAQSLGIGKTQMYSILDELLKLGYATRIQKKNEQGLFCSTRYEFYEDRIPLDQIIKEKSTVSGNRDADNLDADFRTLLNTYSKENIGTKENTSYKVPPDLEEPADAGPPDGGECRDLSSSSNRSRKIKEFTPASREVAAEMLAIIARYNPVYRPPDDMSKFVDQVETMLIKDKQDRAELLRTFEWACADSEQRDTFKGWQSVICTNKRRGKASNPAEIFRSHFSTIYCQMRAQPNRKFAPSSRDDVALACFLEAQKNAL